MGLFLSFSIAKSDVSSVNRAILEFSKSIQGNLKSLKISENNILNTRTKKIKNNFTLILYPEFNSEFYHCAYFISKQIQNNILTINIHDGEYWFLVVYKNGHEITRFTSNLEFIDKNKQSKWQTDFSAIAKVFDVDNLKIKDYLENLNEISCFQEVLGLFELFDFSTDEILDFKTCKPIIDEATLKSISATFLTIDDLRTTKRYNKNPIPISEEIVKHIFKGDFDTKRHIDSSAKISGIYQNDLEDIRLYLDVESLCIKIEARKKENGEIIKVVGVGFTHIMERVYNFLNK